MIYIDCASGIAGDMFAGALIGLGADWGGMRRTLSKVAKVSRRGVRKRGVTAVKFDVDFRPDSGDYVDLVRAVKGLHLRPKAQRLALRILRILAEAESKAHGVPLGRVHLHEAVDSVVDASAAALALDGLGLLDEEFRASVVSCGKIAPATLRILREYGIPVRFVSDLELVTPTGAAILAALVTGYGDMEYSGAAAGAGSFDLPWPNVVRVARVSPKAVLETNVDDCTPEHISHMMSSLMAAGALDVHVVPCAMKKGRIGFLVRVLTDRPREHASLVMSETGSLGVRVMGVGERYEMPRRAGKVRVRFGRGWEYFRVKRSPLGFKPEFDDVSSAAARHGLTFRQVSERVRWAVSGRMG
jgi:pyridinium-3,5-bisthiocarboxylic acid mononucleotide nickel chelatase